ncbi:MAG: BON domain-containing protein [Anaerolineaceae bacterium]
MPKGQQNSDQYLRKKILRIFASECQIDVANLRVGVLNSIAHLAGTVDSITNRNTAEELAKNIGGIRGVVNRIEAPGAPSPSRAINLNLKLK